MKAYRTLVFSLAALVALTLGLHIVGSHVVPPEVFASFAWSIVGIGAAVAGKASIESLAGGGGVKGAVRALMTEAKPEPAQPPAGSPAP